MFLEHLHCTGEGGDSRIAAGVSEQFSQLGLGIEPTTARIKNNPKPPRKTYKTCFSKLIIYYDVKNVKFFTLN